MIHQILIKIYKFKTFPLNYDFKGQTLSQKLIFSENNKNMITLCNKHYLCIDCFIYYYEHKNELNYKCFVCNKNDNQEIYL